MNYYTYLTKKAKQIREGTYDLCCEMGCGHITSSFSCIDILVTLYYYIMRSNDHFILSKGHAASALYTILKDKGIIDCDLKKIVVHPDHNLAGIEFSTGSLGHGLSYAVGMALGLKKNRSNDLVYVLVGDGECQEGMVWEAINFACANNLNNLVIIVDRNGISATDFISNYLPQENMENKFIKFGCNTATVDGHDFDSLLKVIIRSPSRYNINPNVIIALTVKGYGIPQICNDPLWHARCPNKEQIIELRGEL